MEQEGTNLWNLWNSNSIVLQEALVTYMELVMAMADSNGLSELSFFDVALLVAFLHFRDQQVLGLHTRFLDV